MKLIKPFAKFTLATQVLFPLLFSSTSVASAVNVTKEKINNREVLAKIQSNLPELTSQQTESKTHSMTGDELLAQGLSKSAQIINEKSSSDAAKNLAQSTAYGLASTQMTDWLNQYGNASIQISSDKAFSGELLLPFYETKNKLFFSQSRIQRQDEDRTTLNFGLGYRYFTLSKMLGVNSFYDHDLKNHNARLGLGAEFGADYLKLAANGYFRLTDWRESRLSAFHDYWDERPANGFDIRAEGFLPSYPQLGANIKYEKYFGDNVNLKGSNSISDLKKDPQAYTVGLSYTPVPLLSFKLNQLMGDVNETKGELVVKYRFGVPLSQQLDTGLVQQMRTLMGTRYDAVERNNTIVMQYRKHKSLRYGAKWANASISSVDVKVITASGNNEVHLYNNTAGKEPTEKATVTVHLRDKNGNPVLLDSVVTVRPSNNLKVNPVTCESSKDVLGDYTCYVTERWGKTKFVVAGIAGDNIISEKEVEFFGKNADIYTKSVKYGKNDYRTHLVIGGNDSRTITFFKKENNIWKDIVNGTIEKESYDGTGWAAHVKTEFKLLFKSDFGSHECEFSKIASVGSHLYCPVY